MFSENFYLRGGDIQYNKSHQQNEVRSSTFGMWLENQKRSRKKTFGG
jgi:hypothetical protein